MRFHRTILQFFVIYAACNLSNEVTAFYVPRPKGSSILQYKTEDATIPSPYFLPALISKPPSDVTLPNASLFVPTNNGNNGNNGVHKTRPNHPFGIRTPYAVRVAPKLTPKRKTMTKTFHIPETPSIAERLPLANEQLVQRNQQQQQQQQQQQHQQQQDLASIPTAQPDSATLWNTNLLSNMWWEPSFFTRVEGNSLRSWSIPANELAHVVVQNQGRRPVGANVEVWEGPDYTPLMMRVYLEDGHTRPFRAILSSLGRPNTVAVRNTGDMEFPVDASVFPAPDSAAPAEKEAAAGDTTTTTTTTLSVRRMLETSGTGSTAATAATSTEESTTTASSAQHDKVQGGAVRSYPFDPTVSSVLVLLQTDGRPLHARVELLQGPDNIKQVVDIYSADGDARPFLAAIETPGVDNVMRIVNMASMEFPFSIHVTPVLSPEAFADGGHQGNSGDNSSPWHHGGDSVFMEEQHPW